MQNKTNKLIYSAVFILCTKTVALGFKIFLVLLKIWSPSRKPLWKTYVAKSNSKNLKTITKSELLRWKKNGIVNGNPAATLLCA